MRGGRRGEHRPGGVSRLTRNALGEAIEQGEVETGLAQSDVAHYAATATGPVAGRPRATHLQVLANLLPASGYLHGETPTSIDAGIYGFIANIYFFDIDTPLKQFVSSRANLLRHCNAIHAAVSTPARGEQAAG